jgi:hypothetical protein
MRVLTYVAGLVIVAGLAAAAPRTARVPDPGTAVRLAYVAARAECKRPARLLAGLVVQRFSTTDFGKAVADDWNSRSDEERHTLEVLADRVVGGPLRTSAIKELCAGSEIESVRVRGEGVWITVLRHDDDDSCDPQRHSLMFHSESSRWIYDGEWFCGVTWSRRERWRERYGTDYDHAMAILRCEDNNVTPCDTASNWKSDIETEFKP